MKAPLTQPVLTQEILNQACLVAHVVRKAQLRGLRIERGVSFEEYVADQLAAFHGYFDPECATEEACRDFQAVIESHVRQLTRAGA